tara:strand:- start:9068 stop:9175 length:108 start_codon:yes stop_codon:yes gene_type:complete
MVRSAADLLQGKEEEEVVVVVEGPSPLPALTMWAH